MAATRNARRVSLRTPHRATDPAQGRLPFDLPRVAGVPVAGRPVAGRRVAGVPVGGDGGLRVVRCPGAAAGGRTATRPAPAAPAPSAIGGTRAATRGACIADPRRRVVLAELPSPRASATVRTESIAIRPRPASLWFDFLGTAVVFGVLLATLAYL